jgi:diketogulonate reductase-like aldo/keto reductase
VGYRFFDCAEFYGNEDEVGEAIAASGVPREDLYLASKCWTTTIFKGRAAVRMQVERTLAALGTEYVDLYCIHWPVPKKHCEAYLELQTLQAEGKIRSLGVSNYTVEDYDELVAHEGVTVPPAINQIEVNPFLYRKRTLAAFHERGVAIQAYRALRDGKAFDDGMVKAIAAKHSRTAAQVLGRWCVQHGVIYIPKSVLRTRMEENAKVFDFALDAGDMKALDSLTTSKAIDMFAELYAKCVNRGTPLDGSLEGVRQKFTCD